MSICTNQTPVRLAQRTFERLRRRPIAHPRTVQTVNAATTLLDAEDRKSSNSPILRRWSVAELIAAASWGQETA